MKSTFREIADLLDEKLAQRDELFPRRTPQNDEQLIKLTRQFVEAVNLEKRRRLPFSLSTTVDSSYFAFIGQPVFLCGYMKSGTTLLLQLLDGHPRLLALPGDSWFRGHRYLNGKNPAAVYGDQFRDKWLGRIVNPTGQYPFWLFGKDTEKYVDFAVHFDAWKQYLNDPEKGHLLSTVLAYASANPNKPPELVKWIEKTPGNEFEIRRILHYFPNTRFIHIVRDPRENLASLKRLYKTRGWDWNPYESAKSIERSLECAVVNQQNLGPRNYLVLQYEQLTDSPRDILEQVCLYLDIPWHDNLLTPTVNGMPAQANTMFAERKVTGSVRKTQKDKWRTVLSAAEQRAVLRSLESARKFGYEWSTSKKDFWLYHAEKMKYLLLSKIGGIPDE